MGHLAAATGVRSVAVGEAANASGDGAVALGNEAIASGVNSVAIGNGATATADGQVVVASLDMSTGVQTGPINFVTADANGTLGLSSAMGLTGLASNNDVMANTAAIDVNSGLIATNTANIGANAAAISELQGQNVALFDLANENAAGIREAN